jgi:hypothetical protein
VLFAAEPPATAANTVEMDLSYDLDILMIVLLE